MEKGYYRKDLGLLKTYSDLRKVVRWYLSIYLSLNGF